MCAEKATCSRYNPSHHSELFQLETSLAMRSMKTELSGARKFRMRMINLWRYSRAEYLRTQRLPLSV